MSVKSLKKKFKDKRFAAKCDREVIQRGADDLGMELGKLMELCIKGMTERADELALWRRESLAALMTGLFEASADNIVDRVNRHESAFVHVKDNLFEFVDFKACDDAI